MAVVKVNIYWTRMQLILKLSYILILWVKLFQKRFINICVPTAMIILFPPCWCVWCVEFLLQSALKIIESPFLQRKKHSFYKLFPIFFQKKTSFSLVSLWNYTVGVHSKSQFQLGCFYTRFKLRSIAKLNRLQICLVSSYFAQHTFSTQAAEFELSPYWFSVCESHSWKYISYPWKMLLFSSMKRAVGYHLLISATIMINSHFFFWSSSFCCRYVGEKTPSIHLKKKNK